MRKRIEPSLLEKAFTMASGFDVVFKKLEQQVVLRGQSKSTLNSYINIRCNRIKPLQTGTLVNTARNHPCTGGG